MTAQPPTHALPAERHPGSRLDLFAAAAARRGPPAHARPRAAGTLHCAGRRRTEAVAMVGWGCWRPSKRLGSATSSAIGRRPALHRARADRQPACPSCTADGYALGVLALYSQRETLRPLPSPWWLDRWTSRQRRATLPPRAFADALAAALTDAPADVQLPPPPRPPVSASLPPPVSVPAPAPVERDRRPRTQRRRGCLSQSRRRP